MFHNRKQFIAASRRPFVAAGGGGYTAQGIRFNGSFNMEVAPLTGSTNSKVGMISCWIKMMAGDGSHHIILEADGTTQGLSFYRWNDNFIRIVATDTTDTTVLEMRSAATHLVGEGWIHILASWDLAIARAQLYVQDVSDREASPTITNATIKYNRTIWDIGSRGGSFGANLEIADFYVNFATSLDLTSSTNRRKFITAGLAPVDLGSDGSTPTGTAPIMYFHGPLASWHTNDGTGGGFVIITSSLSAAGSNPP